MDTNSNTLSPYFVTGLVQGVGSFTFSRTAAGGLSLYFAIKLPRPEEPLLRQVRSYFGGAGRIYAVRPEAGRGRRATYFRVNKRSELLRVVTHFDIHPLRGTKKKSFEVWREMVLLKQGPTTAPREELDLLAAQLSSISPRART